MKKLLSLLVAAVLLTAAATPAAASDIVIAKKHLKFFIGTYDAAANTFTDYTTDGWDEFDPMGYTEAVSKIPNTTGVYYGQAPWYANLAKVTLEVEDQGVVYAAMIDVKLSYSVEAIITKWQIEGDNLRLLCIGNNFPDLGAAPNLDGHFLFPDGSSLLVARSGGGDMLQVWRRYTFVRETAPCNWEVVYDLNSIIKPFETEFTDGWCVMQSPVEPDFMLQIIQRHHRATDRTNPDGSYVHEILKVDSSFVSLWKLAQKNTGKK